MASNQVTILRWSYSKIKSFNTCARQYYYERVLKAYPREETDATRYGTEFHEAAEFFIRDGTPVPPKFEFALPLLQKLRDLRGVKYCELELGLTENLKPCDRDDPGLWFVCILDFVSVDGDTAFIVDYKTGGNTKYADMGQLELCALALMAHYPHVTKVKAGLLYVVANAFIRDVYTAEKKEVLWQRWLPQYNKLKTAHEKEAWTPKPSGLCRRHCRVVECEHNGG